MSSARKPKQPDPSGIVLVASNRAARHNFAIDDTYECGIVLRGSEVKSLRESKVQIADAFGQVSGNELFLHNLHIAPYSMSQSYSGHDPMRVRKLLLHRHELDRIASKVQRERVSIVPMRVYFKNGHAKVEIGLGKGKRSIDKRHDIAAKDAAREAQRELGRAAKYGCAR